MYLGIDVSFTVSVDKSSQEAQIFKYLEQFHLPFLKQPIFLSMKLLLPQMKLQFSAAVVSHAPLPFELPLSMISVSHSSMIYSAKIIASLFFLT